MSEIVGTRVALYKMQRTGLVWRASSIAFLRVLLLEFVVENMSFTHLTGLIYFTDNRITIVLHVLITNDVWNRCLVCWSMRGYHTCEMGAAYCRMSSPDNSYLLYGVTAFGFSLLNASLFSALPLHPLIPMLSHLILGLPLRLVLYNFPVGIPLGIVSSDIHSTCPSQHNLCDLMNFTMSFHAW